MTRSDIRTWIEQHRVRGACSVYYAHLVGAGGVGLPSAREACADLRSAREWQVRPYSPYLS